MTDPQRGAYTPQNEQSLAFDARAPVRGSRPVPMTLIVSAVVLVTLIVAIFLIYRGGVRREGDAPQPVGPTVGEIKGPAAPESRPADPAAGLQIYRGDPAAPANPAFAPPPEQPLARPTTPIAPADPIGAALERGEAAVAAPPAPALKAPAAPPVPAPKPVTPVAKTVTPAPAAGGPAAVQIGAFSSAALAEKGWNDAARLAPGMAAGKGKSVQTVEAGGKTVYRTAVTGFASRAEATAFCSALKAGGKDCFVR
jgi:hypothetical protein